MDGNVRGMEAARRALDKLASARRELIGLEGKGSARQKEIVKAVDRHHAALNLELLTLIDELAEPTVEQPVPVAAVERTGPAIPKEVWPEGCRAVTHCERVRTCLYYECPHAGRGAYLGDDIDAARALGLLEPVGPVRTDVMGR